MSHARGEYDDFKTLAPDAYEAVFALGRAAAKAGLDKQLLDLIKLRASQINGCAFCVQYHIGCRARASAYIRRQAQPRRGLARGAAVFGSRARRALVWTEALTRLGEGVSDEVFAQVSAEFSEKELAYLTSAVASINVWNRLGVGYRWSPPARQRSCVEATAS